MLKACNLLLIEIAVILSACSSEAPSAKPPSDPYQGCQDGIAFVGKRRIFNILAIENRSGLVKEFVFWVADPSVAPAIGNNPGTRWIALEVGEFAAEEVRRNRFDPQRPHEYPAMDAAESSAWARVVFGNEPILFDEAQEFGITQSDSLTRQLVFFDGPWALMTIVPDEKLGMAKQLGEQGRSALKALVQAESRCQQPVR
jgi:hypothetical protein